jgi:Glycosyltransferase sugar-binding region containing DXD motif
MTTTSRSVSSSAGSISSAATWNQHHPLNHQRRASAVVHTNNRTITATDQKLQPTRTPLVPSTIQQEKQPNPQQRPTKRQQQQLHAIPNVIIFTHAINLLETEFEFAPSSSDTTTLRHNRKNHTSAALTDKQTELLALQQNVRIITALHPTATVRFLTDDDCIESIRTVFSHNRTLADELVRYFINEPEGMYKADLCRGTALYETGGLYFDVDLGVRMSLWKVLQPTTEFATIKVHRRSKHHGAFFQAFMAAAPQHAVILRYVELFYRYYTGELVLKRGGFVGVILLKQAYDEIQAEQLLQLETSASSPAATTSVQTMTMTTTHLDATTELWQEVKYKTPGLSHVPPPAWGTKRACKFVVVVPLSSQQAKQQPLTVPFYSRIAGSRMCPTTQQQHDMQPIQPYGKSRFCLTLLLPLLLLLLLSRRRRRRRRLV